MRVDGRNIAVIEDDPVMGESLVQSLTLEGAHVEWFSSARTALEGLISGRSDLVICDIRLPDMDGQRLFRQIVRGADAPPFLFMTAYADVAQAVELMQEGAADYVVKPFEVDDFMERVQNAMRPKSGESTGQTLGISVEMRNIERLLHKIAKLHSPVLLNGETGSGKEVCTRFLHDIGKSKAPFIAINCAAIPSDLLESQIFGHEQGAFTGANRRHLGYAERAQSGTLFLDEIGELAIPLQAKLLRLIEERTFYRLGGEEQIPFKARLVCATNTDLEAEVQNRRFRSDLFFRINVIPVKIPPLRDRRQDVPWLLGRFFNEFTHGSATKLRGFSSLTEAAAMVHPWPGNVRELKNRVERSVALAPGDWIMPGDMFPEQRISNPPMETHCPTLADVRNDAQRRQIERVLAENDGQVGKTAVALGISRTTLWEKMKRFGLTID